MGKHRRYSQEEDDFIRQHYASMPIRDIADRLDRSVAGVRHRAERTAIPRKVVVRRWTEAEDRIILASKGKRLADVAAALGRDASDVSKRARLLGFHSWRSPDGLFYVDRRGYEYRCENGKRVYIHRETVEQAIGRKLEPAERVHHIDLDKRNNAIENLHLFSSPAGHTRAHWSLYKLCGKDEQRCKELFRVGVVYFDADKGVYQCETSKWNERCETGRG